MACYKVHWPALAYCGLLWPALVYCGLHWITASVHCSVEIIRKHQKWRARAREKKREPALDRCTDFSGTHGCAARADSYLLINPDFDFGRPVAGRGREVSYLDRDARDTNPNRKIRETRAVPDGFGVRAAAVYKRGLTRL
jgi:hypothetical protein